MRKSVLLVASFSTMAMLLTGCQSSLTGDSYSRDEARRVQTIRMGTIESCVRSRSKAPRPRSAVPPVRWWVV